MLANFSEWTRRSDAQSWTPANWISSGWDRISSGGVLYRKPTTLFVTYSIATTTRPIHSQGRYRRESCSTAPRITALPVAHLTRTAVVQSQVHILDFLDALLIIEHFSTIPSTSFSNDFLDALLIIKHLSTIASTSFSMSTWKLSTVASSLIFKVFLLARVTNVTSI